MKSLEPASDDPSCPNDKYKCLLQQCNAIDCTDFEETLKRVNETALSLLDVTCSSIWIFNEIDKTLECKGLYTKNSRIHSLRQAVAINESFKTHLKTLGKKRHLLIDATDENFELAHQHLQKHQINSKFETAIYHEGETKGMLCFGNDDEELLTEAFTKEVAETLSKVIEMALHLKYERENKEILDAVLDNSNVGILIFRNKILYANEASSNITGFSNDELLDMHIWDFVESDRQRLFKQRVLKRLKGEYFSSIYNDIHIRTKEGAHKIIRANVETIMYRSRYAGLAIVSDVTNIIEAEEKIKLLAQAVEQMDELVKITDVEGNMIYVNNALIAKTGYKEIELLHQNPRIFKSGKHPKSFYKNMWDTILAKKIYRNVIINKKKDGTLYYEDQTISPILDKNDNIIYFVATSKDVSSQIELEKKLKLMATTDALTGIYNRFKMNEEIDMEIKKAKRNKKSFALIMFDIDFFKSINDTYGHDVGDRVLEELADIVRHSIRQTDTFARWGGEEFLILVRNDDAASVFYLAEKIRKKVENTLFADKTTITISLGISIYTKNKTKQTLLKEADEALYKAKALGRNKTVVFQASI